MYKSIKPFFHEIFSSFYRMKCSNLNSVKLGLFRIVYCLILLSEIISLWRNYPILYSEPISEWMTLLWLGWIVIVAYVMTGGSSWIALLTNYLFSLFLFTGLHSEAHHVHFICITINLLMLLFPINMGLSLWRWGEIHEHPTSIVWVYVTFGLVLVYMDSAVWKVFSTYWKSGLSLWMGLTYLPVAKVLLPGAILNCKPLMVFLNYLVMAFEVAFPLLIAMKRVRPLAVAFGISMHLIICIVFPIPSFGLLMASFYLLLLPDNVIASVQSWYQRTGQAFKQGKTKDGQRQGIKYMTPRRVQEFTRWASLCCLSAIFMLQVLTSIKPIVDNNQHSIPKKALYVFYGSHSIARLAKNLTGIVPHALFLDGHFISRPIFKIVHINTFGVKTTLPIVTDSGLNDLSLIGLRWKYWSLETASDKTAPTAFVRFSNDWGKRNCQEAGAGEFHIFRKGLKPASKWLKDYLPRLLNQEWELAGIVKDGVYHPVNKSDI